MKNLLIYISPKRNFGAEEEITAKIQIDNSLDLGWKKEEVILVTNFPYQYGGVKSIVISDDSFCKWDPLSTKTYTIPFLYKQNLIKNGETYWAHDFDVFQNDVITKDEIDLELGKADLGLTDKGRMPKWNGGSLFFKETAKDIFEMANKIGHKYKVTDESSLMVLSTNNLLWATDPQHETASMDHNVSAGKENTQDRIKKINITYNFRMWNIRSTYSIALKPIKALHFHPDRTELDFFMYGKNKINTVLMSRRLIKIFNKHSLR